MKLKAGLGALVLAAAIGLAPLAATSQVVRDYQIDGIDPGEAFVRPESGAGQCALHRQQHRSVRARRGTSVCDFDLGFKLPWAV
jgi:hypothetical protein